MIMSPSLGGPNKMLVGVFDGTVGSEASDFCHRYFVETLLHLPSYKKYLEMETSGKVATAVKSQASEQAAASAAAAGAGSGAGAAELAAVKAQLAEVLTDAFLQTDQQLLDYCRRQYINYSASTGVVCLVAAETLTCGEFGLGGLCSALASSLSFSLSFSFSLSLSLSLSFSSLSLSLSVRLSIYLSISNTHEKRSRTRGRLARGARAHRRRRQARVQLPHPGPQAQPDRGAAPHRAERGFAHVPPRRQAVHPRGRLYGAAEDGG